MNAWNNRIKSYGLVSNNLSCLSNAKMLELLAEAKPLHEGIGGTSSLISLDETHIFVKKVPLCELELQFNNIMSTANYFKLPLCYQYGIGSSGFGTWREIIAHIMTTNWVLTGECPNFPIMYHWRILPNNLPVVVSDERLKLIDQLDAYWDNSPQIRDRLEAIANAQNHIYLFLEYVPQTLYIWLKEQLATGKNRDLLGEEVLLVEQKLSATNIFLRKNGFLHMDAHFENILTDGTLIYFSDFGLSISNKFELSADEISFINDNVSFDECSSHVNLLHCIIASFYGPENWEITLKEYLAGKKEIFPTSIDTIVKKYAPVALVMDNFFQSIQKNKATTYPKKELEQLLHYQAAR